MDPPVGYAFRTPTRGDFDAVGGLLAADQPAAGLQPDARCPLVRGERLESAGLRSGNGCVARDAPGERRRRVRAGPARGARRRRFVGRRRPRSPGSRYRVVVVSTGSRLDRPSSWPVCRSRASVIQSPPPTPRRRGCYAIVTSGRSGISGTCRSTSTGRSRRHPRPPASSSAAIEPPSDLQAIHAILGRRSPKTRRDHPEPFERWLAGSVTTSASYDPSALAPGPGWRNDPVAKRIASAGDDAAGSTGSPFLPRIGVVASAARCCSRSFAGFDRRGLRRVMLNVTAENVTGATAVYERAGMRDREPLGSLGTAGGTHRLTGNDERSWSSCLGLSRRQRTRGRSTGTRRIDHGGAEPRGERRYTRTDRSDDEATRRANGWGDPIGT